MAIYEEGPPISRTLAVRSRSAGLRRGDSGRVMSAAEAEEEEVLDLVKGPSRAAFARCVSLFVVAWSLVFRLYWFLN